jgi:peroxiredoxin
MKKSIFIYLILSQISVFAQSSYPYLIKGKIGELNAPAKVYLYRRAILDSAILKEGRFELKGTTSIPFSAELILKRNGSLQNDPLINSQNLTERTTVMLEPGPVLVVSDDSLKNARMTGGALTSDYQRLLLLVNPIIAKLSNNSGSNPDDVFKEYTQSELEFIRENPNSWVSLETLCQLQTMIPAKYTEVAPLFSSLNPILRDSPAGLIYGKFLHELKGVGVGKQAPNFTLPTSNGKKITLSNYRGKYILIEFWASWCGPCRKENPSIVKVYNTYKKHNFEIIAVSLDREKNRAQWLKAIKTDHLAWVHVSDLLGWENQAAKLYAISSIPENFLIDPTGKIIAVHLHGEELNTKLKQVLK